MDRKSIILIGMPGSGKSTIGRLLARDLRKGFLDSDMLILRREKAPLQQIINKKGLEYFAESEERALLSIRQRGQVIATGGSAVLYPAAMEHLKSLGTVVYLEITYPLMERRLWNLKTRGIVLKPGQTLEDLYNARRPLYEKYADITVRTGNMRKENVARQILAKMGLGTETGQKIRESHPSAPAEQRASDTSEQRASGAAGCPGRRSRRRPARRRAPSRRNDQAPGDDRARRSHPAAPAEKEPGADL